MIGRWVMGVFSGVLILVAIAGFLTPQHRAVTSNAPAYNVFHLIFGVIGMALLAWDDQAATRTFLIGFGIIDLYQAFASRLHWFPEALFRWKPADDVLHVVIGVALIVVGVAA